MTATVLAIVALSATGVLAVAGACLAAFAAGCGLAWLAAARRSGGMLAAAREESRRTLAEAEHRAEEVAAERRAESEREVAARREAWEDEERRRRSQLDEVDEETERRHRRLVDRDRALTRRDQLLAQREREAETRRTRIGEREREIESLEEKMLLRLEEISGLSRDAARRQLLDELRIEVRRSASAEVRVIKEDVQQGAEAEAQKIMALAMERLASDFSAARSIATVKLPDVALRGRVIGAEGRNIRAFEAATGMQLVLDDDPTTVTISGFHPIKREVARRSLEKLVDGGVIHPRKVQQVVAQMKKKVEQECQRAGRDAVRELKIRGMHPELVKLLGRLKFRTSYGQKVLDHVKEVAHLCGMMAAELRLDQKLARRAALLHDIGKAVDFEKEGTHPEIGGELGRRYGEHEVVINAIESHHDDCDVIHPIAALVAAADALSGARPGARRRTTVDYIRRISKLEELGTAFGGVERCYALQAGRELRVIVQPRKVNDDAVALLAHDLSQRIQNEVDYPGRIKITVIRALKAQATAR